MKYINKYKTTEEFNSALSELKKLEHYLVYDEETDTCHLKPIPNYIIITTNADDVELIKRTATGSTENITLANGENKIEDIDYGWELPGGYGNERHIFMLDLSNFNSSKVTDMSKMFNGCSSLNSLDLSNFDTSKVTDMSIMFSDCSKLTNLDLSSFDTSQVTPMNNINMFYGCNQLNYIKCKQAFKDWCITNQYRIVLPTAMQDGGGGTWDIVS